MGTCSCIRFTDKRDDPLEIRTCSEGDLVHLLDMYAAFSPKPASQGLPPQDPEACRRWVDRLLKEGENFLAWREGRVIGHVAVIPDHEKRDGELLIFVERANRNRGVGKMLTEQAIQRARELGLETVWLTVEIYNFRAIHLYKTCEFKTCGDDPCERRMVCTL